MKVLYKILVFVVLFAGVASCKSTQEVIVKQEKKDKILPIQKKYGNILGVAPEKVKNIPLYKFIDSWMGTPYRMGGETRKGIDCSFFTQFLYHDVYGGLIERTAEKQYMAPDTDKFIGQEFLKQGDLLFFNLQGSQHHPITHVGVYLGHGQFVHSTSKRSNMGGNGVQISNFNDNHWQKLFVAAGRKPIKTDDTIDEEN
ncbi:C40 family peptidase [Aquimarina longa]|uniref:C40 family peptidase n=1 Tax=Aquimarina longa TaxID=1080221 RepID=UPI0007849385|nr:C40 family peptidase [Aquimarina longa]